MCRNAIEKIGKNISNLFPDSRRREGGFFEYGKISAFWTNYFPIWKLRMLINESQKIMDPRRSSSAPGIIHAARHKEYLLSLSGEGGGDS